MSKIWDYLEQIFLKKWPQALSAVGAYATFRTARIDVLSEEGETADRRQLSIVLVGLAALTVFVASKVTGAGMSFEAAARITLISMAVVIVGTAPFFLLYRYSRGKGSHLIFNILAVQQIFVGLAVVLVPQLGTAVEPARTDFWLLEQGSGQGTVAHRRTCGLLASNIELALLNRAALARSESVGRDIREIMSWEAPRSPADVLARQPAIEAHLRRREAELQAAERDLNRVVEMNRTIQEVDEAFHRRYPSIWMADTARDVLVIILGLVSTWHIVRGVFLPEHLRKKRLAVAAALCGAWLATGALNLTILRLTGIPGLDFGAGELSFGGGDEAEDDAWRTKRTPDEQLNYLEEQAQDLRERQSDFDLQVRRDFIELRRICPTVTNGGLW